VKPDQLSDEVLITYSVSTDRLDIYMQFLVPASITPKRHKTIETTDIMFQMVASNRGVAAMPRWLVEEYAGKIDVLPLRLGPHGLRKNIHLDVRKRDIQVDYVEAFFVLSRRRGAELPIRRNRRKKYKIWRLHFRGAPDIL
jgi:LysR family transcriptional regulator for metE and metH